MAHTTSCLITWKVVLRPSCLVLVFLSLLSCSQTSPTISSSLSPLNDGEEIVLPRESQGEQLNAPLPDSVKNLHRQLIQQGNYSEAAILLSFRDFKPRITTPARPSDNGSLHHQNITFSDILPMRSTSETTLEGSWHTKVGWGFVLDGNYSAAEAAYRQALRQETNSAEAYLGLGMALMFQGKREQAILSYEEALKIQPNNAAALVHLGYAYADSAEEQSENREKARGLFQQATDLGDPFALLALMGLKQPEEGL